MYLPDALDTPSVVSVSELSLYLKSLLEMDDNLQNIWVQGEVSNCKTYPSGHCYFTLKEGEAQLLCVFFKHSRVRSSAPGLRDGMAIAINGRISYYERDGKLQCYVESVKLLGEGALFQQFEQLKARLAAEGLFDPERKRPLPQQPAIIGIVTSPQAAALQDMLRVLRMRYPLVQVIFSPALVQGAEAPASIATALDLLNEHGEAEVIIVGRGGGSIEELWAFNEEVVARAIARSRIPVISGVGHETDFTIADFVADHRASTPTAAATVAVPNIEDWRVEVQEKQLLLTALMRERIEDLQGQLEYAMQDLRRASPLNLIDQRRQQIDDTVERLQTRMQHMISLHGERLRGVVERLHALSPLLTIARGYAVVRHDAEQVVVTSIQQVHEGDRLTIQVQDGYILVEVCQ
ncbi:MAG TPA: exodeoxyribonuclease VII large subunit [Ktedonobacteraceae bacterium]|nr:exodeoxyribonuclease VII large subunit [Ktedonobacteraceae bacterium]